MPKKQQNCNIKALHPFPFSYRLYLLLVFVSVCKIFHRISRRSEENLHKFASINVEYTLFIIIILIVIFIHLSFELFELNKRREKNSSQKSSKDFSLLFPPRSHSRHLLCAIYYIVNIIVRKEGAISK